MEFKSLHGQVGKGQQYSVGRIFTGWFEFEGIIRHTVIGSPIVHVSYTRRDSRSIYTYSYINIRIAKIRVGYVLKVFLPELLNTLSVAFILVTLHSFFF